MKIAYICYWGINDVLTISSAIPTIEILSQRSDVSEIDLYTFERDKQIEKINYSLPKNVNLLQIREGKLSLISKFNSYLSIRKKMIENHKLKEYNVIIGRSIFGGISAYLFNKLRNVRFVVESFEPHTEYMVDTGVWSNYSIKTKILNYYHHKILNSDCTLIVVSENYRDRLLEDKIDSMRLKVVPCTVDVARFSYSQTDREEVRRALGIDPNCILAIYLGKFGGLYYDDDAFVFFRNALQNNESIKILILSNQDEEYIQSLAKSNNFPLNRMIVKEVRHVDVPKYLSASDIAFATIKQFPSSRFSSAIKIGEYWANGLPMIITKGVGDDSQIVEKEKIGLVVDIKEKIDLEKVLNELNLQIDLKEKIANVAEKYRGRNVISQVYIEII